MKFFLYLLLISSSAFAKAHHEGTLSGINLGARYSSILEKRGVIFYQDFQIDPVVGIFLFDDRLEFLGDTLSYHDFVYEDKIRLRTRLVSISDNPLFPSHISIKENRPDRPDTFEFSNSAEFFFPGYNDDYKAELDLTYSKDISQHHGNYFEALGKIKITDFYSNFMKQRLEPNLVLSAGFGDKAHNQYLYGPSDDSSGLTNISCGFWLAFPEEADRFYPVVQLMYFSTVAEHGNKEFSKGYNQGYLASAIFSVGVLE